MTVPFWRDVPREVLYLEPRPAQPSRMTGLRFCTGPGCGSRVRVLDLYGTGTPCQRCRAVVTEGHPRTK